jgi:hypothetical protein
VWVKVGLTGGKDPGFPSIIIISPCFPDISLDLGRMVNVKTIFKTGADMKTEKQKGFSVQSKYIQ